MPEPRYSHYAHTANSWGAGRTIDDALERLKAEAGTKWLKQHGHEVLAFSRPITVDEFKVHPVDGSLSLTQGVTCTIVEKHRPTPKYRKPSRT